MKKITLTIAAVALLITAGKAQDKAFEKGNFTVDLGAGIGFYGTKIHTEVDQDYAVISGGGIVIETRRVTHDTTDAAASTIYPLSFEYGITNWLGVGARFAYSKYFQERDTVSNVTPSARAIDADLVLNFHLIKSKRFDMPINTFIGYSNFKYSSNDPLNSMAKGGGLSFGIGLNPRIYFGDHIGMYFNVGYAGYSYRNLIFSNNDISNANEQNNWVYRLKGNGANLGIGLIAKF